MWKWAAMILTCIVVGFGTALMLFTFVDAIFRGRRVAFVISAMSLGTVFRAVVPRITHRLVTHCGVVRGVMLPSATFSTLLAHFNSIVHVMNNLCIVAVWVFHVLVLLSVLGRSIALVVILDFTLESCFPISSGFCLPAVFSGVCISDLLLTFPKRYGLFQAVRLVDSILKFCFVDSLTVVLANLLIAILILFDLSFAFLGLCGLFLNDLLLHLRELCSIHVLHTFVGTPFFLLRSHLITHFLRVHSAVEVSFSVFLNLGS
ncbi:hypothetical protein MRX96_005922 [Rhipicephalus microplus]